MQNLSSSKLFSGHSGHSPNSGHQYISPDSGPGQVMTGRDERFDCLKACDWSVGNQSHYLSKLSNHQTKPLSTGTSGTDPSFGGPIKNVTVNVGR